MTRLSRRTQPVGMRLAPSPVRRKRGRPAGSLSIEIRRRIVDVALRDFILSGFDGASIARIAREAGVSRQLIHQRYGNKVQLFDAVMAEREALFFAATELPVGGSADSVHDTLLKYAQATVAHLLQPRRIELARLMFGGLHRYPALAKWHLQAQNRARDRIAAYLDDALAARGVGGVDTAAAADDFRALLIGVTASVVMGLTKPPGAAARRHRIAGLVLRFMRGVGLPP
jgi:AcrR family transcriptional regulator